jgi:hypothetical protein
MAITYTISWDEFNETDASQIDFTDIAQIIEDNGFIQVTPDGVQVDVEAIAELYQQGPVTNIDVTNLHIEVINESRIETRFLNENQPEVLYGPRDVWLQIKDADPDALP